MKVNHYGYEGSYKFLTIPALSTPFQKKQKTNAKQQTNSVILWEL